MDARVKPAHDPQCVAPRLKRSLPGERREAPSLRLKTRQSMMPFKYGSNSRLSQKVFRRVPSGTRRALTFTAQTSVFFTRSAVIGRWRSRLPVIWNTALAIAGATVTTPISPMPLGGLSVARILVWISGISLMRRTG